MSKQVFIYGLKDPRTDKVHYVGASENPKKRLYEHVCDAKYAKRCYTGIHSPSPKESWVINLLESSLRPIVTVLERCSKDSGDEREEFWIEHYLQMGNSLTNVKRMAKRRMKWQNKQTKLIT